MAGDGEAVGFVADLDDQVQGRRFAAQCEAFAAVGEDQRLQAGLAALTFRHADHRHRFQADVGQGFARGANLALAAVDQDQVGTDTLSRRDLAVALLQRLAHRRVVVAGRDAADVVAAVFGPLHRAGLAHHA